ncbi:MAG: alpha/beta hydrolase [Hyalangium sp.]|uniref:alpha/beta hydrolase n=1 Tax=Hyalangium sp. TaxID=2028555 RepID=UPI003899DFDD
MPDARTSGEPSLSSSHGSGKLPCESTGTVPHGSTSYTYCVVTIAGSQLKIIEPQDTSSGPLKLAIYLHGDGARAHDGDTAPRLQAPWTFTHRVLYVSARAPNRCAWWTKPTLTTCLDDAPDEDRDLEGKNAEVFVQIIAALRGGWDILDEPILFGGSSGGSVFLTASFLPKYGNQYHGVYALSCGGEPPWAGHLDWDSANATLRGPSKLFYTYGDQDPLLTDIQDSISFFGAHSFPLEERIVPNSLHCAFDHLGRVTEVWGLATGG